MSHHETKTSPADVVRQFIDSLARGELETSGSLLSDDVEWHEIGRAEPTRGLAALRERMSEPDAQGWDITGETHDIVAGEDHVVALITATAKKGDRSLTYRVAEVYHVKDGKITGRWAMSDDTEAIARFFAS